MPSIAKQFTLGRTKTIAFLGELAGSGEGKSLYLPAGLTVAKARYRIEERVPAENIPENLPSLVVGSGTGGAIFSGPTKLHLILPAFPTRESYSPSIEVGPLASALEHDWRIALVLVRLGSYGVGVCEGERLVASKVGTGLVHGRHRQGGSSAQRFALRRRGQIDSFLDRVCGHIGEKLAGPRIDYLAYGGARVTIITLQKQCSFLKQFDDRLLPPLLDIPDPRQRVLEAAVGRVWSSRVFEWTLA